MKMMMYEYLDWRSLPLPEIVKKVNDYFTICGTEYKKGIVNEGEFYFNTFSFDLLRPILKKKYSTGLIPIDHSKPSFPIRVSFNEWMETGDFDVEEWMDDFITSETDTKSTMIWFFQVISLLRIPISYFDSLHLPPDKIANVTTEVFYSSSSVDKRILDPCTNEKTVLKKLKQNEDRITLNYRDSEGNPYKVDLVVREKSRNFGYEEYTCGAVIGKYTFGTHQRVYLRNGEFGPELTFNRTVVNANDLYRYQLNSVNYGLQGANWVDYNEALYQKGIRVEAEFKALRYDLFAKSTKRSWYGWIGDDIFEETEEVTSFDALAKISAKSESEAAAEEKEFKKMQKKAESIVSHTLDSFRDYHLTEIGKEELSGYLRYLMLDENKDRAYHFIVQSDSVDTGRKFAEELLDLTKKLGGKNTAFTTADEIEVLRGESSTVDRIVSKDALIILNALPNDQYFPTDESSSSAISERKQYDRTWKNITKVMENKIVIFVVPKDILNSRVKSRSFLYYRFFRHHIYIGNMTEDEIYTAMMNRIKTEIGSYSDDFEEEFREYIDTVYSKADLANMDFVNNLFDWMRDLSYQKIGNCRQFTKDSIPFYHRNVSLETIDSEFQKLVGLEDIKETFRNIGILCQNIAKGKEMPFMHMVFRGNPGTGKTTVARMVAKLFSSMGVIQKNYVCEISATDMLGMYVGHSGPKVEEYFKRSEGGVLFIDEAYVLNVSGFGNGSDSYRQEVVSKLLKRMELKNNPLIIFSGYDKEMGDFLKSNPGLTSRVGYDITFPDYDDEELIDIFKYMCEENGFGYDEKTIEAVRKKITSMRFEENFGNARSIENIFTQSKIESLKREDDGWFISEADIVISKNVRTFESLQEELNSLIGIDDAKDTITEQVLSNRFSKENKIEMPTTNHMIFVGNPGTGKTTTARLFSEMLFSIGVAKSPRAKMITAKDLYVQDAAEKLNEYCREALGGVLFIDEIYMLAMDPYKTAQVVSVLLEILEERKEDITFILAGYERQMEEFLNENQGLKSRFPITVKFRNFTEDELCEIFKQNCEEHDMSVNEKGLTKFRKVIRSEMKKDNFGNGRTVRNIFEDAYRRHAVNFYTNEGNYESKVITADDIEELAEVNESRRGKVGF